MSINETKRLAWNADDKWKGTDWMTPERWAESFPPDLRVIAQHTASVARDVLSKLPDRRDTVTMADVFRVEEHSVNLPPVAKTKWREWRAAYLQPSWSAPLYATAEPVVSNGVFDLFDPDVE